jgi:PAS domain S-box-containing protein
MSDDIRKIHQLKVDNVTNIISALSDIIFIIDSNGFFLDYYSSDPSRFLIDEKNIVGSSIYDIFSKEEADTHISFFNDSIRTGKINSFEYSIINNGIKRSFEARISKLDDFSVLSIVRDITERTNAQRELIENEKKIRRLIEANNRNQRLESLGFLAGGIAHDFNNLILGLFGSIENARNELQKGNIQDAVTTLS